MTFGQDSGHSSLDQNEEAPVSRSQTKSHDGMHRFDP